MKNIKYRTNEFFERDPGQEFSEYEDDYALCEDETSKDYDQVIVVGQTNIQEKIQSSEGCALDKILDKYLDQLDLNAVPVDTSGEVEENYKPDLADLAEEYSRVESLKEKYGLDDSLGYDETIRELNRRKQDIDSLILEAEKRNLLDKESEKDDKTQDEI